MWHLEPVKKDVLTEYYSSLANDLRKPREKKTPGGSASRINTIIDEFEKDELELLLTAEPEQLIKFYVQKMDSLLLSRGKGKYDDKEYSIFIKTKQKVLPTQSQQAIYDKYNDIVSELELSFDYQKFISNNRERSYWLAEKKGRNTCTYCNRLYTLTLTKEEASHKKTFYARPEFDHWFPKSYYPMLALSFYNLIPSCKVCNSSLKGSDNFTLDTHIHPYVDYGKSELFYFTYSPVSTGHWKTQIKDKCNLDEKVINTIDAFKLEEAYEAHSDFELKDLLDFTQSNNETYLNTLLNDTVKHLGVSTKQAYRMLFGTCFDNDEFLDRPFSKLKKDILKELKVIE